MNKKETVFPRIAGEDGPRILREHAHAGAHARYGRSAPKVMERIARELAVVGLGTL